MRYINRITSIIRTAVITVSFFIVPTAIIQADFPAYEAPLDIAAWTLNGSAIECSLTQDIPHYGMAAFTSSASRKSNMNFDLSLRRHNPSRVTEATLSSEPPLWKHNKPSKPMGQVTMFPGASPVNMINNDAWNILTELEQGMFPTFAYSSWLGNDDQISVALSAVNFQPVYDEFLACVAGLLPYSFDDIAETFVYFEYDRSDFTKQTRESLAKIGAWLEVDKTMELVLLAGHTDSKGKTRYNRKLGMRRALAVKTFFVEAGIAGNKIKVQSFADLQPQSSNATPEGRAKNRRVMLKMVP